MPGLLIVRQRPHSITVAHEQKIVNTGFRIFSVAPGVVDTGMQDEIRKSSPKEFSRHDDFVEMKQTGILTRPEEVARKYLDILTTPEKYPETLFSLRDLN